MDLTDRINAQFLESAQLKEAAASKLAPLIARAAHMLTESLLADGKVLACGNGGSAADAQHFAAELVGRFERERPELRAIALTTDSSVLTAIANDYSFDEVFAKQVRAWGTHGDILLAISTSGNARNVVNAVREAKDRGMRIIALTGKGGGIVGSLLQEEDVHVCVPHDRTARIQEVHLLTLHAMCDAMDICLFGEI
ncbi:MAG: phosphoheptose isomerase [Burkholderiales bacterium]|jgi:D-sedoheptulose 7-phosphate isomerase|nr:phosphoheptose isomerase [Burkholderiales bacterium]